ncbi:Hsp20/alpha crystallin family protein [Paenibacillus macerans]|uniref:Hsp20/alpha crystallin family protein n=1 Tax=Paenibacillus macerans TaxID=44252 RepID=UPI000EE13590|nr:Hsp20/alpha crystallin family protein [Paenibacillus macerans]GBK62360.1 hypothetical protein PbDSM24746_23640 [Paenibacillus macerans]GBK68672.1 hypothetical protein PbJCM17693_23800 [Paenibacillus macerans]
MHKPFFDDKFPFLNQQSFVSFINDLIQKSLSGQNALNGSNMAPPDPQSISQYVSDILKKTLPDSMNSFAGMTPQASVSGWAAGKVQFENFETHQSVITRFRAPANVDPQDIAVWVGAGEVKVRLPDGEEERNPLPRRVRVEDSKGVYKDGVFEIRMPKETGDEFYREISIKFS